MVIFHRIFFFKINSSHFYSITNSALRFHVMRKGKIRQDRKTIFYVMMEIFGNAIVFRFINDSDNIFRHSCWFSQFHFTMNEMFFPVESCSIKIRFKRRRVRIDHNQSIYISCCYWTKNALPQRQQCDKKADSCIHD